MSFDEGICHFKVPIHIPTSTTNEYLDKEIERACLLYNIAITHSQMMEEEEAKLYFSKVLSILTVRNSILELHDRWCTNSHKASFRGPTSLTVLTNIGPRTYAVSIK